MKLRLLRNATQVLTVNNKSILIDPMLAGKDSFDAFAMTGNTRKNPLVDLPINKAETEDLISRVDAVLLTHLHLDHWDTVAKQSLPKDILVLCQPENIDAIRLAGFTNIKAIENELTWSGGRIIRTGAAMAQDRRANVWGKFQAMCLYTKINRYILQEIPSGAMR